MPTNDERLYYIRLHKVGFQTIPVQQAFLDARPIVKTEAVFDEDGNETSPAVLYSDVDALTFEQAMRLYKPHSVALMKEAEGEAPVNLGTLDKFETLPEEMTHVLFSLNSPKLKPLELAALVNQINALGEDIQTIIIPWGEDKQNYLKTGTLPTD